MVTAKEYEDFMNYLANKESKANNVTIPADQLKSYQKWKEMANKEGKNYTYSYAHDTACTPFHMSPWIPDNYVEFEQPIPIGLATFDNATIALGTGTIIIENEGSELLLLDVLYVPYLQGGLISGSALSKQNYTQSIDKHVDVRHKDTGKLFRIPWDPTTQLWQLSICKTPENPGVKPTASLSSAKATRLWHQRLGYANLDTMREMTKNELVNGFPLESIHRKVCKFDSCMLP
jgi:hypothetical protein